MKTMSPNYIIFLCLISLVINLVIPSSTGLLNLLRIGVSLQILIIPGIILIRALKLNTSSFSELSVFGVGLSVAYSIFVGLTINFALPIFGVQNPLSNFIVPLFLLTPLFLLNILLFHRDQSRNFSPFLFLKSRSTTKLIFSTFFISATVFLSYLGSTSLNNSGSSAFAVFFILFTSVVIFVIQFIRGGDNFYSFTLYSIALSLLLSLSLRSAHITGWDINDEFKVFQLTQNAGFWRPDSVIHAYNSCLSITILPTIMQIMTKIPPEYIYKFVFQLIFSVTPVAVYFISRIYLKREISFIAGVYFLAQPIFIQPLTALMRQEIALLFFALVLLIILKQSINKVHLSILFMVFTSALVVSHYSTSYISLGLISSMYFANLVIRSFSHISKNVTLARIAKNSTKTLTLPLLMAYVLITFLWNVQLTRSSDNLIYVFGQTLTNMSGILKTENRSSEAYGYLSLNSSVKKINQSDVDSTISSGDFKHPISDSTYYNRALYSSYKATIIGERSLSSKLEPQSAKLLNLFVLTIKSYSKFILIPSLIYLTYLFLIKNRITSEYYFLTTTSILSLFLAIVLPSISQQYNVDRLFLQAMIIVGATIILFTDKLLSRVGSITRKTVLGTFISMYFLLNTNVINLFLGGYAPMTFNNFGADVNKFYFHDSEYSGLMWLKKYGGSDVLQADSYASLRISSTTGRTATIQNIIPQLLQTESTVFTSYSNNSLGITWIRLLGRTIAVRSPNEFLEANKSKVFSSKNIKIFN